MESLGDDMLTLICSYIDDPKDRKSLSQVNKSWCRVENPQRSTLTVICPDYLPRFLPRFPNLLNLKTSKTLSNELMRFVADTCPKLQVLDLLYEQSFSWGDFDDEGLSAVSKGCRDLRKVVLRGRHGIGNRGIASLGEFSRNLRSLDLGWCSAVSDDALVSIGSMNNLETLDLKCCFSITDVGLASLTKGPVCKTLKRLSLAECDRITDTGVIHLKNITCLEALNLKDCGLKITNIGGVTALAEIRTLKTLNLSWLGNLSDATMVALARNCTKLEVLNLTGCISISGNGIRTFSGHKSLKWLYLKNCNSKLNGHDLEHVVLGCSTLEYISIDQKLRVWLPKSVEVAIANRDCMLDSRS